MKLDVEILFNEFKLSDNIILLFFAIVIFLTYDFITIYYLNKIF